MINLAQINSTFYYRFLLPKLNVRFWIGKNKKLYRNSLNEMSLRSKFLQRMYGKLVAAPPESLPTRQNGVENRDKALFSLD